MDEFNLIKSEFDKICSEIDFNNLKKIIITGDKKCGKSSTLRYYANNYNDDKMIIYLDYSNFRYDAGMSNNDFNYYYELILVRKMFDYIKNNYQGIYNKIAIFNSYVNNEFDNFCGYLSTKYYCNNKKDYLYISDLLNKFLVLLKKNNVDKINLIIDHFDFVGESSARFQNYMKVFFNKFNKVIITSNDKSINNSEKREELIEKGYSIINIDYSKNIKIFQNILSSIIIEWTQELICDSLRTLKLHNIIYYINDVEFMKKLIIDTDGNIDTMLNAFKSYFIQDEDINSSIKVAIRLQKELDSLTYKRILHL